MKEMNKTFYFMAGLPRSGSTLLSSILNQNPRFYSGPSSPVVYTMLMLEQCFSNDEFFIGYPKPDQAREIISSILPQYYSDVAKPVIFDKNRSWTIRMEYIQGYFGIKPKVICPVRDTAEILTSFISMIHRNPMSVNGKINFIDEQLVKLNIPLTDDNRCEFLAGPNGIFGQSVEGIRKALMEGYDSSIHFVEYQDLVNSPEKTMSKIYEFLEEKEFEHNFNNLKNINRENDEIVYGFSDMHEVRSELKSTSSKPEDVLSKNILEKCKNTEFWRMVTNEDGEEDDEYLIEDFYTEDDETSNRIIG